MHLTYQDLTIRDATAADAACLSAWWCDGAVMAHAGFPNGLCITPEQVAESLAGDRDDHSRRLIIEIGGQPAGEMNYRLLDGGDAEIGIKICDASRQERGHGRRLLSMLIRALFAAGCRRIVLDTNLKNTRAQHVYELLGFRREGVRVDCWQDQLGAWQSAVDYVLWPADFVDYAV